MPAHIGKYFLNCFLLLIPVFIWNIIFIDALPEQYSPEIFGKDIPPVIGLGENLLRIIVFVLPLFMIFSLKTKTQKIGLLIYLVGLGCYFFSWMAIISWPESEWSMSVIGFTAPAFTTLIWFVGMGLIGNKAFLRIRHISRIYIVISALFVVFHTLHAYMVYQRL